MTSFPSGLSRIDLDPFFVIDQARSDGGDIWQTEDADPYWKGTLTTSKLNHKRLGEWRAFIADCQHNGRVIDFIDPVYRIPDAYRQTPFPGGFTGTAELVNLDDAAAPVVSGLPIGLVLTAGDVLNLKTSNAVSAHMLTASLVVSSISAQALPIIPPALPNVFAAGSDVVMLDPVVRLTIVPGTWRAPRTAQAETIGSCDVQEASVLL